MREGDKGITLVALIVTIIILLILISVSLGAITQKNFINKAQNAVDKASQQENDRAEKEDEAIQTWNYLPGNIIKSPTSYK